MTDATKPLTLTDEECLRLHGNVCQQEVDEADKTGHPMSGDDHWRNVMRAAFALGAARQRARDAEIARRHACYLTEPEECECAAEVAAAIEGEEKP